MFAGKTTRLLRLAELARGQVVYIKHAKDTRYSQDTIVTHDHKVQSPPAIQVHKRLEEAERLVYHADAIFIDEIHFYTDAGITPDRWAS